MVPNLTGFLVMRAPFNMAAYCRSPRVTGPTMLEQGITREIRDSRPQNVARREAAGRPARPVLAARLRSNPPMCRGG